MMIPQLELAWFPSQIFWLVVSFTMLYTMMKRVLLPPLIDIMDRRDRQMQDILREADEMNLEADRLMQAHKEYMMAAEEKSAQTIQVVHEEIAEEYTAQEQALVNLLKKDSRQAERDIERQSKEIKDDLGNITEGFIRICLKVLYGIRPRKKLLEATVDEYAQENQP